MHSVRCNRPAAPRPPAHRQARADAIPDRPRTCWNPPLPGRARRQAGRLSFFYMGRMPPVAKYSTAAVGACRPPRRRLYCRPGPGRSDPWPYSVTGTASGTSSGRAHVHRRSTRRARGRRLSPAERLDGAGEDPPVTRRPGALPVLRPAVPVHHAESLDACGDRGQPLRAGPLARGALRRLAEEPALAWLPALGGVLADRLPPGDPALDGRLAADHHRQYPAHPDQRSGHPLHRLSHYQPPPPPPPPPPPEEEPGGVAAEAMAELSELPTARLIFTGLPASQRPAYQPGRQSLPVSPRRRSKTSANCSAQVCSTSSARAKGR